MGDRLAQIREHGRVNDPRQAPAADREALADEVDGVARYLRDAPSTPSQHFAADVCARAAAALRARPALDRETVITVLLAHFPSELWIEYQGSFYVCEGEACDGLFDTQQSWAAHVADAVLAALAQEEGT